EDDKDLLTPDILIEDSALPKIQILPPTPTQQQTPSSEPELDFTVEPAKPGDYDNGDDDDEDDDDFVEPEIPEVLPKPDIEDELDSPESEPGAIVPQIVDQDKLDIQEKLKKQIKRTSRANQPIEFTDSAFGFPLPPPSHSTLVMLDYRFPVHVERAIYRLSHLKLANPKRSLREQVLLSNFMYAYLNLVDHTLHLEQHQQKLENEGDCDEEEDINFENNILVDDDDMIDLDTNGGSTITV
ncbi:uncharacterized protein SPAPADRAFT_58780, partial [Spathaspora passalidarum NRRL Y-27907]